MESKIKNYLENVEGFMDYTRKRTRTASEVDDNTAETNRVWFFYFFCSLILSLITNIYIIVYFSDEYIYPHFPAKFCSFGFP